MKAESERSCKANEQVREFLAQIGSKGGKAGSLEDKRKAGIKSGEARRAKVEQAACVPVSAVSVIGTKID